MSVKSPKEIQIESIKKNIKKYEDQILNPCNYLQKRRDQTKEIRFHLTGYNSFKELDFRFETFKSELKNRGLNLSENIPLGLYSYIDDGDLDYCYLYVEVLDKESDEDYNIRLDAFVNGAKRNLEKAKNSLLRLESNYSYGDYDYWKEFDNV